MTHVTRQELEVLSAKLLELSGNPRMGLPHETFLLVSQCTPMINVDLLVKNDRNQTLLTWRADEFYGPGWHIPGGIIRFKETFSSRINAVARTELGCEVSFNPVPIALNEVMAAHRDVRGHFISLLFECTLSSPPAENLKFQDGMPKNGEWQWHDRSPEDLIRVHEMYRAYIDLNETCCVPAAPRTV